MGTKFSKKKQGYAFDKSDKSTGKKNPKSGKLNRRWKSVDVYTQTGNDEANVIETSGQVKATVSMDDLREDHETKHVNGLNKTHMSSSDDSSDVNETKKKKKKKMKLKKSKDKKNKNNDNEKKRLKKKNRKDNMEAAVVISVSDVSDVEEDLRHSAIMVNNPVYQSADLPETHRVKTSSFSSSDNEKEPQQPSGDDLANEILEVVSSVQLIQDIEETLEIESLPEPPPVPRRTEEEFQEEYETLEKVQFRSKRLSSSSSSSSSSSDEEEHYKCEGQITITTNNFDSDDDGDIVYENAILRSNKEEPIAIPYAEEAPKAVPEIPENNPGPKCEVVKVITMPNPEFIEVRKISRSKSSSSSSSEDEEIITDVPEPLDPFKVEEEPPKGPIFEDVLIATAIVEDTDLCNVRRETEFPAVQVVVIDDEEPPAVPEKPPRLRRTISNSSSSSSSADEGELIISEEVLPPPPVKDDIPAVTDEVVQMAETIAEAIVLDTMENIKVEAVLLPREVPEPSGEADGEPQTKPREPDVIQAQPRIKKRRRPKSAPSSSSSSSSSD